MKAIMAEESRPKRLCSEIQLFDLCSRNTCKYRDGRYCGDSEILAKFEAISEEDETDRNQYLADEENDSEDFDYDEYDDDRFDLYDNENEDEDEDE
jgi:hypothetical protein